jgi:hypothetical protein
MPSSASSFTYRAIASSATGSVGYSRPTLARAASYPSLSPQVALVGDILERFRLIQPIVVSFEQGDKGKVIASDDIFFMYGEGSTRQEAVRDYLSSLSEYYSLIGSYRDAPSVELFSYLQTYLQPK